MGPTPDTSPRLLISAFGPPHASLDGSPIRLQTDKVTALLVYLCARPGLAHSRASLGALLWPDQDAERAGVSLRQALYRLRRALGEGEGEGVFLEANRDTVRLLPEAPASLDLRAFDRLLDEVAAHPHRRLRGCPVCGERLEAALALARGPLLEGLHLEDCQAFEEWATAEGIRLQGRLLDALDARAEQLLAAGDYDGALACAQRQLGLEPWHEQGHRQAMLALARRGRRAQALRQYAECRQALARELGCEPEPATVALAEQIRAGGELAPPGPEARLPRPLTPLVGRARELAQIVGLLSRQDVRLMTLYGLGGSGKTRLALAAGQATAAAFPDGAHFVSLAAADGPEAMLSAIAGALGLAPAPGQPLLEALARRLGGRAALLILDNLEQLAAHSGLLSSLAAAAPDTAILVTSRVRLNLRGEHALEVGGLGAEEALALFTQRAGVAVATGAARAAAERIARLTGGLPLALELAASQTRAAEPAALAAALERSLDAIGGQAPDLPPRQRGLRAVFEHSWALLAPGERELLVGLAVCQGGFDYAAALALAGEGGLGSAGLPFAALLDAALVRRVGAGRYDIHELVRQYAAEELAALPDGGAAAQAAHGRHYLGWLAAHSLRRPLADAAAALQAIAGEWPNLRAAWLWAAASGEAGLLAAAADNLLEFLDLRGWFEEGLLLLRAALDDPDGAAHPSDEARRLRVRLLATQAGFCTNLGRSRAAAELYEQVLALIEREPAHPDLALIWAQLAALATGKGEVAAALAFSERAVALGEATGSLAAAARGRLSRAFIRRQQGDPAVDDLQVGLDLARRSNHWQLVLVALNSLALARIEGGGGAAELQALAAELEATGGAIGSPAAIIRARYATALTRLTHEGPSLATLELIREAIALCAEDPTDEPLLQVLRIYVAVKLGRYEEAQETLAAALAAITPETHLMHQLGLVGAAGVLLACTGEPALGAELLALTARHPASLPLVAHFGKAELAALAASGTVAGAGPPSLSVDEALAAIQHYLAHPHAWRHPVTTPT